LRIRQCLTVPRPKLTASRADVSRVLKNDTGGWTSSEGARTPPPSKESGTSASVFATGLVIFDRRRGNFLGRMFIEQVKQQLVTYIQLTAEHRLKTV